MPHLVIEATANLRLETSPGELLEQANEIGRAHV